MNRILSTVLAATMLAGCESRAAADAQDINGNDTTLAVALSREMTRIRAATDSIDAIFQPLPLLRPAQQSALRRFGNAAQLAVAAGLGVPPDTRAADLDHLVRSGRLLRIADSTDLWIVRRLDHSTPYLTPAAQQLLTEVAKRFQQELTRMGAPPFRVEVTSMLRSAEDHEALRRVNPNAAAGRSTHQYGTTFDVAYNAFAPPAASITEIDIPDAAWLADHLREVAGTRAEVVAARRSRELMAILGKVLLQLQEEGRVMVTLEELQPVFHMTVRRD